jgi:hypothetical protein
MDRTSARAEIVLLQFDIVGHSRIVATDSQLQHARRLLQRYITALTNVHLPVDVTWAGDGGWCWFPVGDESEFGLAVDAAVDILGMLPRINEILVRDHTLEEHIQIRLSADTMNVQLDPDPSHFAAPRMNEFMKNERAIGLVNLLVVTDAVRQHLKSPLRRRFDKWRRSDELNTDLYVYDGRRHRNALLSELSNHRPEANEYGDLCRTVPLFEGDRYMDLCAFAYGDIELDSEVPHVESLPFLAYRNALANGVLEVFRSAGYSHRSAGFETSEALQLAVAETPYEVLERVRFSEFEPDGPASDERARRVRHRIDPMSLRHVVGQSLSWCNENMTLAAGEEAYFFNADALGYFAEVGSSTILDHAIAETLTILDVIGNSEHPEPGADYVPTNDFHELDGE